jgi:hypothetical protein
VDDEASPLLVPPDPDPDPDPDPELDPDPALDPDADGADAVVLLELLSDLSVLASDFADSLLSLSLPAPGFPPAWSFLA